MRHFRLICWLAAACIAAAGPLPAQRCAPGVPLPGKTALVLSGGGAKGLAHIGVLRVLDSLGIRPDLVVGTSMGAVVGAMYASGYSGREIDSLARALPISDLFLTYRPRAPSSLGALQPLIVWEQGERGFALQSAAVREPEVAALVNAALLRGNLLARGDFDRLPIPFRALATDLRDRAPIVLKSGDLAQAVRASFAIPLVFAPERIDGRVLADGGLSANIPVAAARAAGADRVIVSDATEALADSTDLFAPIRLADRLLAFLFRQDGDSLRPGDVRIRPDVDGFTSLNFAPARVRDLIARGVAAADSSLGSLACTAADSPVPSRLPRHLAGVATPGASLSERLTLLRTVGLSDSNDSLDVAHLRSRIRRLNETDAFHEIWLNPTGTGDTVGFTLRARRAPRRTAGMGLAYDNELGGRMWVGGADRNVGRLALEASGAVLLGELRREAYIGLRRPYEIGHQLLTPTFTLRGATENLRVFDSAGTELPRLKAREAEAFAGVERSLGAGWLLAAGGQGQLWRDPITGDAQALGAVARLSRTSRAGDQTLRAEGSWNSVYHRALIEAAAPLRVGALRLRPRVRLAAGDSLPLQRAFSLGGDDGFPGLHLGERRGDREAMAGLLLVQPIAGPLVVRVEGAVGRSANGGSVFGGDGWLAGIRAGIGAETPLGPVRFEYGVASGGRDAVFVRLGRWF